MRRIRFAGVVLLFVAVALAVRATGTVGKSVEPVVKPVSIRWLGHASFLITGGLGHRIVLDPFNAQVGYPLPHPTADIVAVTHDHFDHNAVEEVRGSFRVVKGPGTHPVGVDFKGIASSHGEGRGPNTIFAFDIGGIRFCHLGDLGTLLSSAQVKQIGPVDVLMIPVGGHFTIDAAQATKVIAQLKPKIVIPMHYRTPALSAQLQQVLAPVDPFLKGKKRVVKLNSNTLELTRNKLPKETTIYVLKYSG